ncbi:hypothetical protein ACYKDZ_17285 [Stutzerimonas stutzeri]|uniref:hypothetical protein n=1 Tax=Stutzerimonas stutzeri TaxID=316 RepID=UPI003747607C
MSEASEDKTKRKYISVLRAHPWHHQHSVFYTDAPNSIALLDDMIGFKQLLRRRHPQHPFLIRIQLLNRDKNPQAFLSILAPARIEDIQDIAGKTFSADVVVLGRVCTQQRLERIASAIKAQKPHNLERFFSTNRVRRWALLNKHLLIKR